MQDVAELGPGEVGFITGSIKEVADTAVGDTITEDKKPTKEMLPGFKPVQAVVFCGLFPVDAAKFEDLRAAMGRLRLNDASFSYEMETSAALGFGFAAASWASSTSRSSRSGSSGNSTST
jgi:GTP-binding protein LepA